MARGDRDKKLKNNLCSNNFDRAWLDIVVLSSQKYPELTSSTCYPEPIICCESFEINKI